MRAVRIKGAMTNYAGQDGRQITKAAREAITRNGITMELHRQWTQYPAEHRAAVRAQETANARAELSMSRGAIESWAKDAKADATRRLNRHDIGTPAEESRRVAQELRIGRLVDAARAAGNPRKTAADLQDASADAYAVGDRDEAKILARAALELSPQASQLAGTILGNVEADEILEDPARAKASRDLRDVDVVLAAYDRDVTAAYSQALQQSTALARDLGENGAAVSARKEATEASIAAKSAAWYGAKKFGDGKYVSPVGVLAEGPSLDGPPDGAKLPEGAAS